MRAAGQVGLGPAWPRWSAMRVQRPATFTPQCRPPKPIDGQPATHANGGTIGFTMSSPEQAAAWHRVPA
jgi:hypothetical protein